MSALLLLASSLLISGSALAQDDVQEDETTEDEPPPAAAPAPPRERVGLETQPFFRPIVGGTVISDGDETFIGASGGVKGGFHYFQKKKGLRLQGTARAQGSLTFGNSGLFGYDARVGTFLGPWYEVIGIAIGPDVFYNSLTFGSSDLAGSPGLGLPAVATFNVKVLSVWAGVQPDWFFNPDRLTVDWSEEDTFGFGGEFTKFVGAGINLDAIAVTVTYSDRTMHYGHDVGYGVGFRVGG